MKEKEKNKNNDTVPSLEQIQKFYNNATLQKYADLSEIICEKMTFLKKECPHALSHCFDDCIKDYLDSDKNHLTEFLNIGQQGNTQRDLKIFLKKCLKDNKKCVLKKVNYYDNETCSVIETSCAQLYIDIVNSDDATLPDVSETCKKAEKNKKSFLAKTRQTISESGNKESGNKESGNKEPKQNVMILPLILSFVIGALLSGLIVFVLLKKKK